MRSIFRLAIWILPMLAGAPAARALDFTLATKTVQEDGYPREVSCFSYDAKTTVLIRVPVKWRALATPAAMVLTAASSPGSEVRVEKSPFTPSNPFKDADLERYRQQAVAQVPPGATGVRLTEEKENPLPIFDWTDHEYVLEYSLYGQNYKQSVLFLNLDAVQQLRVTAVSTPVDFERAHNAAFGLLRSWQASSATP